MSVFGVKGPLTLAENSDFLRESGTLYQLSASFGEVGEGLLTYWNMGTRKLLENPAPYHISSLKNLSLIITAYCLSRSLPSDPKI